MGLCNVELMIHSLAQSSVLELWLCIAMLNQALCSLLYFNFLVFNVNSPETSLTSIFNSILISEGYINIVFSYGIWILSTFGMDLICKLCFYWCFFSSKNHLLLLFSAIAGILAIVVSSWSSFWLWAVLYLIFFFYIDEHFSQW